MLSLLIVCLCPRERWGWQYVEPAAVVGRNPDAKPKPVWREPEAPDVTELQERYDRAKQRCWPRLQLTFKLAFALGVIDFLLSLAHESFVPFWWVVLGGLVWAFGPSGVDIISDHHDPG